MYHTAKFGSCRGLTPLDNEIVPQALSARPYFNTAQLLRNDTHSFHSDSGEVRDMQYVFHDLMLIGTLLTKSAAQGVDFLPNDKDFLYYLEVPSRKLLQNPEASCFGRVAAQPE